MSFDGFSPKTIAFLRGLEKNNSKSWFDAHRADYEQCYLEPAKNFVEALGPRLQKLDPAVQYEAKVNKSIFRINRDLRFSKDKTPYKTHLDLWFWKGGGKGWDNAGYFLRLAPKQLVLGAGVHQLEAKQLENYRQILGDAGQSQELHAVLKALTRTYELAPPKRKSPPRGFTAAAHPELLLHEGLVVMHQGALPDSVGSPALVDDCTKHFAKMKPLNTWIEAHLSSNRAP